MARVTLGFSVDSDTDADIIRWWEDLTAQKKNRSAAVRAAIRAYKGTAGLTLGDVMNAIGDVKGMLRSGVVMQSNGEAGDGDPNDTPLDPLAQTAQDALDGLG